MTRTSARAVGRILLWWQVGVVAVGSVAVVRWLTHRLHVVSSLPWLTALSQHWHHKVFWKPAFYRTFSSFQPSRLHPWEVRYHLHTQTPLSSQHSLHLHTLGRPPPSHDWMESAFLTLTHSRKTTSLSWLNGSWIQFLNSKMHISHLSTSLNVHLYTVSQKNVPTLASCSFEKHGLIW